MAFAVDPGSPYGIGTGLHVVDLARSLKFYRDLVGCRILGRLRLPKAELVSLAFGNSMIKLLAWDETPSHRNPAGVAVGLRYLTFHVRDPDAAVAACQAAGAVVIRSAYQFSPAIRNAIVEDPDGNIVEFCRGLAWASDVSSK
jgi:catechol 2,3-dioxygenase-like lactoylglutathione lyase family enzyme